MPNKQNYCFVCPCSSFNSLQSTEDFLVKKCYTTRFISCAVFPWPSWERVCQRTTYSALFYLKRKVALPWYRIWNCPNWFGNGRLLWCLTLLKCCTAWLLFPFDVCSWTLSVVFQLPMLFISLLLPYVNSNCMGSILLFSLFSLMIVQSF